VPLRLDPARSLVEQRVHFGGAGTRRREPLGIEVEVEAQHPPSIGAQARESLQLGFGDLVACRHLVAVSLLPIVGR
jgi:hypothetical protein